MIENIDILKDKESGKRPTSGNSVIDFVETMYELGELPFGSDDRDKLIKGIKENPEAYTKDRIQEYINSCKKG